MPVSSLVNAVLPFKPKNTDDPIIPPVTAKLGQVWYFNATLVKLLGASSTWTVISWVMPYSPPINNPWSLTNLPVITPWLLETAGVFIPHAETAKTTRSEEHT